MSQELERVRTLQRTWVLAHGGSLCPWRMSIEDGSNGRRIGSGHRMHTGLKGYGIQHGIWDVPSL